MDINNGEILFLILIFILILIYVRIFIFKDKDKDDWYYPDGKNGMVKVKLGTISANTDSPRWQNMFLRNIEMSKAFSCETATKIVNGKPLTQEEIDKIQNQKDYVDKKYGTKE